MSQLQSSPDDCKDIVTQFENLDLSSKIVLNDGKELSVGILSGIEDKSTKIKLLTQVPKVYNALNDLNRNTNLQEKLIFNNYDQSSNEYKHVQNNINNQRGWTNTLRNAANGGMALAAMASTAIPCMGTDVTKQATFNAAHGVLENSLQSIMHDSIEYAVENSKILAQDLKQDKSIMGNKECNNLIKSIELATDEVIDIMHEPEILDSQKKSDTHNINKKKLQHHQLRNRHHKHRGRPRKLSSIDCKKIQGNGNKIKHEIKRLCEMDENKEIKLPTKIKQQAMTTTSAWDSVVSVVVIVVAFVVIVGMCSIFGAA